LSLKKYFPYYDDEKQLKSLKANSKYCRRTSTRNVNTMGVWTIRW